MGQQRSSSLYVGAMKTSVSRLEGAAAIAGPLKIFKAREMGQTWVGGCRRHRFTVLKIGLL